MHSCTSNVVQRGWEGYADPLSVHMRLQQRRKRRNLVKSNVEHDNPIIIETSSMLGF